MTACVNKHSRRVALAISASLVGALSLGAAAPAVFAESSIETQFAPGDFEDGTEFAQGDVALAFKPAFRPGTITTDVDAKGVTTVTADQVPLTVTTSQVTLAGNSKPISVVPGTDFRVALYKADEDGDPTGTALSGNRVTEAGDYVLTVTPLDGSEYTGQTFKKLFKVVPAKIEVDNWFEHDDLADHRLSYTGSALEIGFSNDGEALEEGTDYSVRFVKRKNADGTKADGTYSDSVIDAGTYDAVITGKGVYEGSSTVVKNIEVDPYDLDAAYAAYPAGFVVAPFKGEFPEHPTRVFYHEDGKTDADVDLDVNLVNLRFKDNGSMGSAGKYDASVRVDQDAIDSGNVIYDNDSPITVTAVMVDEFCDFTYNGQALQDSYDVFLGSDVKHQFDWSEVDATFNGSYIADANVLASNYNPYVTGTYTITFGYNAVDGDPVSDNGNAALNGKVFAGTKTVTVHVWAGSIDADTGLWVYGPDSDTVAIQSYEKAYDGMPLTAAMFHVGNKDNTVSTDNGLVAKLYKADGTEVSSAVDAGEYYLEVTSDSYKLSGTVRLPITIGKVDLSTLKVGKLVKWNGIAGQEYLPKDSMPDVAGDQPYWCNNNFLAIWSLGLTYDTGNSGAAYGEDGYLPFDFKGADLIPANVDVTVERNDNGTWKPVAVIREAGQYRVTVTVGSDVASNYILPEGENSVTLEFTASANGYFSDVQPGAWYYGSVNDAARLGYVKGISGTDFFAPERDITRADATVIIARMAGWDDVLGSMSEGEYKELVGTYVDAFGDVDESAYYARAVAWAAKAGVVHGNNGSFRPDDPITREEFAAMLSNYAALIGEDVSVDADEALADAAGADTVSGWARDAVAWAYENGVMGNNGQSLDGQGNITRAMTAAMCVNYQSEKLPTRPTLN